mmetsp:Transcript_168947/g.543142  ORF Transcript_168947/g.543142 Transcript_168947/m.543142 type:complete len:239 (+) Transcript_168947:596-1312(+)
MFCLSSSRQGAVFRAEAKTSNCGPLRSLSRSSHLNLWTLSRSPTRGISTAAVAVVTAASQALRSTRLCTMSASWASANSCALIFGTRCLKTSPNKSPSKYLTRAAALQSSTKWSDAMDEARATRDSVSRTKPAKVWSSRSCVRRSSSTIPPPPGPSAGIAACPDATDPARRRCPSSPDSSPRCSDSSSESIQANAFSFRAPPPPPPSSPLLPPSALPPSCLARFGEGPRDGELPPALI